MGKKGKRWKMGRGDKGNKGNRWKRGKGNKEK